MQVFCCIARFQTLLYFRILYNVYQVYKWYEIFLHILSMIYSLYDYWQFASNCVLHFNVQLNISIFLYRIMWTLECHLDIFILIIRSWSAIHRILIRYNNIITFNSCNINIIPPLFYICTISNLICASPVFIALR